MITFLRDPGGSEEGAAHPGEEFVEILAGELAFWIDERKHHGLQAGHSLSFRRTRRHRWQNDGNTPTTVPWIDLPVVETGTDGSRGARCGSGASLPNGATE
jgi:quercetin dioxygenase-like cupin family protein